MPSPDEDTPLRRLARAAGVADTYEASGRIHHAPDATLRAALSELGHPADDAPTALASLRRLRRQAWTRPVDPVAVVWRSPRAAPTRVTVSATTGADLRLTLTLEDGTTAPLPAPTWGGTVEVDGARGRGAVTLPDVLPLGYHRLRVDDGVVAGDCTVIVAPDRAPALGDRRTWGWMLQAYAVRSSASWGQGEYTDVAALAEWSAGRGADFVVINPVHATAPVVPQQPSPYSPTSRRFASPLYLHVPDVPAFAALDADTRAELTALPPSLAPDSARIDRDEIWRTKRAVLRRLFGRRDTAARAELDAYRADRGTALERFATFSALAEVHGLPFQQWPAGLTDPRTDEVAAWAREHDEEVAFHAWLQLLCERQLTDAQRRATDAGMQLGVIHDLAIGVDPGGADVWALPDEFARSMSAGAPPDAFNRQGQNWGMPPPLPGPMRERGFATQRELLGASLRAGGGLRIDHILGLSRLFWIPRDADPTEGTYVRYPAEERFAVLTLEAHRAGAVVIGEDLGTPDARIRDLMRRRGVAGSAVLWFEIEDGGRRPASRYPRSALASVTTHDLPTATGWWDGSTVDRRDRLGLLDESRAEADARLAAEQASMLALLRAHGCLDERDDDPVRARVLAMHRFLASTPAAMVAGALWDAVGDPRPPNVPGTVDEHPNWRLPLAVPTPDGYRPVLLEELRDSAAVDALIRALAR